MCIFMCLSPVKPCMYGDVIRYDSSTRPCSHDKRTNSAVHKSYSFFVSVVM